MRAGVSGFQKERLVQAREALGLTQVDLARIIDKASPSISKWENGMNLPEADTLQDLAKALKVPVAFFLNAVPDHGEMPIFFRSMASTTETFRKRTRARLKWSQDISLSLQQELDFPKVNVPRLDVSDYREIRDEDIEEIAGACRKEWGLGSGPISNVVLAMENAGIIVVKEDVGSVKMDGLSHWSTLDDRPYVLIAKDKDTCVRSRMDAAHELGHLVLHHSLKEKALNKSDSFKQIENQAFLFASCFLMPAESFGAEIWSPSLDTFVSLKERWKTSVAAMIVRCKKLGIISEGTEKNLWKYYSSRGWRKCEPLDNNLVSEEPRMLARSIRLLIDEGIKSREDLINDFRLSAPDIESICGLPRGYMTAQDAEIIAMPELKATAKKDQHGSGNVIPFKSE